MINVLAACNDLLHKRGIMAGSSSILAICLRLEEKMGRRFFAGWEEKRDSMNDLGVACKEQMKA